MCDSGPTRIGRTQPLSQAIRIASSTVASSPPATAMVDRAAPLIGIVVETFEPSIGIIRFDREELRRHNQISDQR